MTTSKTTRRAILAGTAATATACTLPAAANTLSPDPIFAAIERHRASWERFARGVAEMTRFEDSLPQEIDREPRVWLYEYREHESSMETRPDGACVITLRDDGPLVAAYASSIEDIECNATHVPKGEREAWIREKLDGLERDRQTLKIEQAKFGMSVAQEEYDQASADEFDCRYDMLSTVPTTAHGLAALSKYIGDWEGGAGEFLSVDGHARTFAATVEDFACNLAGIPFPDRPEDEIA